LAEGEIEVHDTLSDSDVERVVGALRAAEHECAWKRILQVGRVVLDALGGDEENWRARRDRRDVSLRRLVSHPHCPFKKTALSDAVNVHLFVERNPEVLELAPLSPTQVTRVVGLPNDVALSLLYKSAQNGWSVRDLLLEIRALRKQAGKPRGRPPSSAVQKAEAHVRRALEALRAAREQLGSEQRSTAQLAGLEEIQELVADLQGAPIMSRRRPGVVLAIAKAPSFDTTGKEPARSAVSDYE
jgi:hypothetical protein